MNSTAINLCTTSASLQRSTLYSITLEYVTGVTWKNCIILWKPRRSEEGEVLNNERKIDLFFKWLWITEEKKNYGCNLPDLPRRQYRNTKNFCTTSYKYKYWNASQESFNLVINIQYQAWISYSKRICRSE